MIIVDAPSFEPSGPWVQFIIATPDRTFEWPPEPYGWGAGVVGVESTAAKDNQKAAGRGKAKTKKSGPGALKVTIEMTFLRANFSAPQGACALLNAIDPNNPNGEGGPFDFMSADFNRRLGKSIDVDKVGKIVWRGHIGTCTIDATEWVPEPPKEAAQGTKTPDKSTEHSAVTTTLLVTGSRTIDPSLAATVAILRARKKVKAEAVAARGFDGPEKPTSIPTGVRDGF